MTDFGFWVVAVMLCIIVICLILSFVALFLPIERWLLAKRPSLRQQTGGDELVWHNQPYLFDSHGEYYGNVDSRPVPRLLQPPIKTEGSIE